MVDTTSPVSNSPVCGSIFGNDWWAARASLDRGPTITMRWIAPLVLFVSAGCLAVDWIVPGVAWYDTDGKKIDAHGGAVVQRGDTFYWVGYSASSTATQQCDRARRSPNRSHRPDTNVLFVDRPFKLEESRLPGACSYWDLASEDCQPRGQRFILGRPGTC